MIGWSIWFNAWTFIYQGALSSSGSLIVSRFKHNFPRLRCPLRRVNNPSFHRLSPTVSDSKTVGRISMNQILLESCNTLTIKWKNSWHLLWIWKYGIFNAIFRLSVRHCFTRCLNDYPTLAREFQGFRVWGKFVFRTLELTDTPTNLAN